MIEYELRAWGLGLDGEEGVSLLLDHSLLISYTEWRHIFRALMQTRNATRFSCGDILKFIRCSCVEPEIN